MKTTLTATLIARPATLAALALSVVTALPQDVEVTPAPAEPPPAVELKSFEHADALKPGPARPGHPSVSRRAVVSQNVRRGPEIRAFSMQNDMFGGQQVKRPLMIRSSRADARAMDQLSEDLIVMARILDKTVADHGDNSHPKAAGIDILTLAAAGSRASRTMYVDDYGAIFTLNVNMPLKAEPKPEETELKESTRKGAWEDTRNELFGQKRKPGNKRWQAAPAREFDQGEVDELKNALIDALKNATNIRHLKPSDLVTVVVRGAAYAEHEGEVALQFEGNAENETLIVEGPVASESTLVLRVTKMELERSSAGKESGDLRKSVRISIY